MSLTVTCPHCQAQTNVRDEMAGKRVQCASCRTGFVVSGQPGTQSVAYGADRASLVHVQPKWIILAIIAIAIPATLWLYKTYPGKVADTWAQQLPKTELDVKDVVDHGLQNYLTRKGLYDPKKSHAVPHALDISFAFGMLNWSMPKVVGFTGTTTQGAFGGNYCPQTGQVVADVELGGLSYPGTRALYRGTSRIHITGHVEKDKVVVQVDE